MGRHRAASVRGKRPAPPRRLRGPGSGGERGAAESRGRGPSEEARRGVRLVRMHHGAWLICSGSGSACSWRVKSPGEVWGSLNGALGGGSGRGVIKSGCRDRLEKGKRLCEALLRAGHLPRFSGDKPTFEPWGPL